MRQLQLEHQGQPAASEPVRNGSHRVPLERKVVLKFHHFGGFFIEYSANVSLTGMFIRTEQPKPPGSVFIFEVWLGDEYRLVHGVGEVVWVRAQEESAERPAGMGVRFLKIDDDSRNLIQRVIDEHVMKGGTIFEIASGADSAVPFPERRSALGSVEPISVPMSEDDLLELDEEILGMSSAAVGAPPAEARLVPGRPVNRIRLGLAWIVLAALLGGAAYLVGADLLPF